MNHLSIVIRLILELTRKVPVLVPVHDRVRHEGVLRKG